MKKYKLVFSFILFVFSLFFVVGVWYSSMYISNSNYSNNSEKFIIYQYKNLQNISSNYALRIIEMSKANKNYVNDLSKIINDNFNGRYGANGNNAIISFLHENNVALDSSITKKIIDSIESGRIEFAFAQTKFLDSVRSYRTSIDNFVQGYFIKKAGYPKINFDEYDIIVDQSSINKFENKIDKPVDF